MRTPRESVTAKALTDAFEIANSWKIGLDIGELIAEGLGEAETLGVDVDIVAIGKASREMADACHAVLGNHVRRTLIVTDEGGWVPSYEGEVMVGSHPLVSDASIAAGERLVAFLGESTSASATIFLVSGGASSLCALPCAPLTELDLRDLFGAALEAGINITTLNQLRAATSQIAGGAVLRHVRTASSVALIMVDNVISGAPWVASGLTYNFEPTVEELDQLVETIHQTGTLLGNKLKDAGANRRAVHRDPPTTIHRNIVVAEPSLVLAQAISCAEQLGYRVVDLGSAVRENVVDVTAHLKASFDQEARHGDDVCILGSGEVIIRVEGTGRGGRCQEFAWLVAPVLASNLREAVFVATATDGRDYIAGVGGAWVDNTTMATLAANGISWSDIARNHNTFGGLTSLNQLLEGSRTGWNLCDLYVTLISAA